MEKLTEELLKDLYTNQKLSIKKIKQITKASSNAIRRAIEKYQLDKTLTKADRIKGLTISKEELENLYLKQGLSVESISKLKECSKNKVWNLIEIYQIPIRTEEEVQELRTKRFEENFLRNHGCKRPYQIKEIKEQMIEKVRKIYSTGIPQDKLRKLWATSDLKEKSYNTKKRNNSLNTSKAEEEIYALLVEHFSENDVLRQYKSPSYPYPCDFYIKSLDLYIEYQGTWCHGNEPYNPNNRVHQEIVNKWSSKHTEYSDYAVKIWTERDPEKRKIAKENNLNWKEFFSMDELSNWLNSL